VDAGGPAALDQWSHADVAVAAAAVDVTAIISAAATAKVAAVFGFFVVIILQWSAKEEVSCY
jgi:hypothetical protein